MREKKKERKGDDCFLFAVGDTAWPSCATHEVETMPLSSCVPQAKERRAKRALPLHVLRLCCPAASKE